MNSLVPALQVLQELLGLGTVGGKVGRDNVHVVSGTDSLFLFLDLAAVQIGDFPLDRLDGLYLVHRLDVQADDQAGFHIQKISQHTVIQLRRKNLDEADRPILLAHAELFTGAELKARRSDKVLGGQPRRSQPVPFKPERHLLIHVENTVKLCQPRLAAQRFRHDPQPLEVVENVGLDALQTRFGSLEAVSVDTEGQVLGLDKAVIALGQLVLQHGHVLGSDTVEVIPLEGNGNRTGKGFFGCRKVQKRQLKSDRTVEVVEEVTPALKDCHLVLVLRELIVDVLKLDGLGVMAVRQTANAVRPHPLIGDAVLCGLFLFVRAVGAGNGGLEQLKQEYEKTTVLLEQEKRKMQRLKNRQAYLESGSRKQRTHRLITRGAAIESIAPQTKELSEAEFYSLMESILNLPQAEHFIRSATENHARISGQEKGGD